MSKQTTSKERLSDEQIKEGSFLFKLEAPTNDDGSLVDGGAVECIMTGSISNFATLLSEIMEASPDMKKSVELALIKSI